MKTLIAIITATLLSAAAMAGDDTAKHTSAATFDSLDKNADQQISRTEAGAEKMLSDSFASVDTNGDGYVSKAEYAARTKS
jgi:Ca2+-binding EF-hand superfamily protein